VAQLFSLGGISRLNLMDTKWLITIVIGNVIAAIVKESASWVIKRMPKMTATLIGKLKPTVIIILRRYWRVIFDLVIIILSVITLRILTGSKEPMSRQDVYLISFAAYSLFYWNIEFSKDLGRTTRERLQNAA